jgi:hypothetical protein
MIDAYIRSDPFRSIGYFASAIATAKNGRACEGRQQPTCRLGNDDVVVLGDKRISAACIQSAEATGCVAGYVDIP